MKTFDQLLEDYRVAYGKFSDGIAIRKLDGEIDLGKLERDALAARDAVRLKHAEATGQDLRVGKTGVSVKGIEITWANARKDEVITTPGKIVIGRYAWDVAACRFKLDPNTILGDQEIAMVWKKDSRHRLDFTALPTVLGHPNNLVLATVRGAHLRTFYGGTIVDPKVPRYVEAVRELEARVVALEQDYQLKADAVAELQAENQVLRDRLTAHFLTVHEPVDFQQCLDEALKAETDKVLHHNAYPTVRGEKLVRANNARQRVLAAYGQLKSRSQKLLDACRPFQVVADHAGSLGTVQVSGLAVRELVHAAAELRTVTVSGCTSREQALAGAATRIHGGSIPADATVRIR